MLRNVGVILSVALIMIASLVIGASQVQAREENGKTFEATGATIYYEVLGSGGGTPLVLVNGGPGFDHTYLHASQAWDTLAKDRRVVMYDQRGTGHSIGTHPGQTFTLKDQIDDLEAVRAQLGAEKIDLLGHSWGGYLVMAYSAMHPERIAHLFIVDSAAPQWKDIIFLFKEVFPDVSERRDAFGFAEEMGEQKAIDSELREYFKMLFYSTEKRDAFVAALPTSVYKRDVNKAVNSDVERFDLNPEIRKFKFPVMVITGRFDMNVAPVVAYKIHQGIPGSKFHVFEHSGHLPFYEEPDGFVQAVEEFLAGK
ncbi:MAG TPA: alpha/beta hydrolase [Candidatus Limnocylindria bacterium]|nr:alpha/beta hydrolase [Candidatus Limnocylindria bacterium]